MIVTIDCDYFCLVGLCNGDAACLLASQHKRSGFDLGSIQVRVVVDKAALGQTFLQVLKFSPVTIVPPMPHTHVHLKPFLIRRTSG